MIKLLLKKKKDQFVLRRHPWIFSGAIARMETQPADGDLVEVCASDGRFLAIGHYHDGSIAVRILTFEQQVIDQEFWNQKIKNAYDYRQILGLTHSASTNCYRLVHAEGDGMSGLIIDIYNKTAVVQCHSIGMHQHREMIKTALINIYGEDLEAVYDKSAETLPKLYASDVENAYLYGASSSDTVMENGHQFRVDWVQGQKTGFFLDQRDNRAFLSDFVKDKSVLNAFCYSGGFSIYALKAGAKSVDSVDISAKATNLTDINVALNPSVATHESYTEDVLQFLKENKNKYEVMVIDPPAFAKSVKKRHNAVQGYKRLNKLALEQIASGGILFTFSCSQVVDKSLFYNTIVAAAIEAKRKVRVLRHLSQPADHPVNLFHPEGAYLKGLILYVE